MLKYIWLENHSFWSFQHFHGSQKFQKNIIVLNILVLDISVNFLPWFKKRTVLRIKKKEIRIVLCNHSNSVFSVTTGIISGIKFPINNLIRFRIWNDLEKLLLCSVDRNPYSPKIRIKLTVTFYLGFRKTLLGNDCLDCLYLLPWGLNRKSCTSIDVWDCKSNQFDAYFRILLIHKLQSMLGILICTYFQIHIFP